MAIELENERLLRERPWLKEYDPEVPYIARIPTYPAGDVLRNTAASYPDKDAIWFYGTTITFWELYRTVNRYANALMGLGVKQGDRVGLLLPNCPQFVIAFWAIVTMGGVVVNMNPMYTVEELEFMAETTEMTALITFDGLIGNMSALSDRVNIPHIIITSLNDYIPGGGTSSASSLGIKDKGWKSFADMLEQTGNYNRPRPSINQEDPCVIQFTGGTTGTPKGATLSHANIVTGIYMNMYWGNPVIAGISIERRKSFCVLPYFHVYGEICQMSWSIKNAATQIILPRFEIEEVMNTLALFDDISYFAAVPAMLNAIVNHPRAQEMDLGKKLVFVGCGAAPCPPDLIDKMLSMDIFYQEGCGMSETVAQNISQPCMGKKKVGSIGVPYPSTVVRLVDPETGEDVQGEPFKVGEIVTKGPLVMVGYWNNPQETANQLKDGWLYTGDLAYRDEDWHFTIVDRSKDMIISNGYNVFPSEVDNTIFSHPKVFDVMCVGVPDEKRGEVLKAFVVLKPDTSATPDEILQWCRERLVPYKIPKDVEFRSSVPRNTTGKALRRILREEELAKLSAK
ncbi:MAG: long-chain fatty acid--CoA ligase [Syntrophomonadaceae bacterium]|mgnify:CR=1 FL=1|nr:long-chain fatty acid--CoA ligase [Syntrophomonadaceae bacterium]